MGDKQKSHFGLILVRATMEKRRREPRGGREGRRRKRRRRSRYGILIFLGFDLNPKVFGMEISSPLV